MGILDNILAGIGLQRREAITGAGTSQAGLQISSSGYRDNVRRVNSPAQAMNISAVFRCVDLISNGIATMTLRVKRLNTAKGYYVDFDGSKSGQEAGAALEYLINVRPNERMTGHDLKKYTIVQKLLQGNALWLPVYDMEGVPVALYLISPGCWSYDVMSNTYDICDPYNGINGHFLACEVFHFKNITTDGGYMGISTITWARESLTTAATAEDETQKRIATGGRFKAFVTQSSDGVQGWGEYEDAQMEAMSDQLNQRIHEGADITFVPGRAEIKPYSMTNSASSFWLQRSLLSERSRDFLGCHCRSCTSRQTRITSRLILSRRIFTARHCSRNVT